MFSPDCQDDSRIFGLVSDDDGGHAGEDDEGPEQVDRRLAEVEIQERNEHQRNEGAAEQLIEVFPEKKFKC